MEAEGTIVARWCTGCGVLHAGAPAGCARWGKPYYPDPTVRYRGKDPAYDAQVDAREDDDNADGA